MGQVKDALQQQSYQNWAIIGLLALLSVGLLFPGALNTLAGQDDGETPTGDTFTPIDYNTYSVPIEAPSEAETVVMVSTDAEMPEKVSDVYGDYLKSASELETELADSDLTEGEDYYVQTVSADGTIDAVDSGTYDVAVYDADGTFISEFTEAEVPEEIEKFRYTEDRPLDGVLPESSDLAERGTFQIAQVYSADDNGEVNDIEYDLPDGAQSETFTQTVNMEVDPGTDLLGEVNVANFSEAQVSEMTVSVQDSEGVTVYEQTGDEATDFESLMVAEGEAVRGDDYDEKALAKNPVLEDGEFTMSFEVELADGVTFETASGLADVTLSNLDDTQSVTVTVE